MSPTGPGTEAGRTASIRGGLATLGPGALRLRAALDGVFTGWAAEVGAAAVQYPPLMRVEDLHRLDYFQNFPHLAILGAALTEEAAPGYAAGEPERSAVPAAHLTEAAYALPSAACYNVYLDAAGRELPDGPHKVTTVATCFRRETHYEGLRRLLGFSMREIVCVGTRDEVMDHLQMFRKKVSGYLVDLGLPVEIQTASDPFFDADAGRALMAQLFPVKEEFVFGGSLAIGSLNFHRNFFGERCEIRTQDGELAFTGCVAFGLERWISALTSHFGVTEDELADRVQAVGRP
ncbi:aminoacyl--tRNA ligase-related protein [Streptomyces nanhaiensis]|uniref:aminoacyl--tRNA ligase-related protein n=1 Tax=Streptomyces nanhaiensis TaxID=679319 RepID=UPI00399C9BD1